jgi:hypothetical protein
MAHRLVMLADALVLAGYLWEQLERASAPLVLVALGHALVIAAHFVGSGTRRESRRSCVGAVAESLPVATWRRRWLQNCCAGLSGAGSGDAAEGLQARQLRKGMDNPLGSSGSGQSVEALQKVVGSS